MQPEEQGILGQVFHYYEHEFTWIGSNMPQGILIGVPGGGRTSGRGSRGNGVIVVGASIVFSGVEVSFPVPTGVNVVFKFCSVDDEVGGTGNLVGGLGLELGPRTGERNSHPSR